LLAGLPFINMELVDLDAFRQFTERTFASDPKSGSEGNVGGSRMSIENRRQLENTRVKLVELEQQYSKTDQAPGTDTHVRELTLRSLRKRINQFKEEIARFEARVSETTPNG
jgi:hypothetical protein